MRPGLRRAVELFGRDVTDVFGRRDAASVHHGDAVADRKQFFDFFADDQNARAAAAQINERVADHGGRPHVHAPGGLFDDENARAAQNLAPDDVFLQIAARKAVRGRRRRSRSHPEALDHLGSETLGLVAADKAALVKGVARQKRVGHKR